MAADLKTHSLFSVDQLHNTAQTAYSTDLDERNASEKLSWCLNNVPEASSYLDTPGCHGYTALQIAARLGNWAVAHTLLSAGAKSSILDPQGFTVLHLLACVEQEKVTKEMKLSVLDLIFQQGHDLELKDPSGNTAVHLAAWHHNWDLVKRLVLNGAIATTPDSTGYSLFHRLATAACQDFGNLRRIEREGVTEMTKILQNAGLDLNCKVGGCEDQATPLHIAARRADWSTVEVFLLHGADPTRPDTSGQNLLHRIAKAYKVKGQNTASLLTRLIKLILDEGVDVDTLDREGNSALQLSLRRCRFKGPVSHKPLCWYLLASGARLDAEKISDASARDFIQSLAVLPKNLLCRDKLSEIIKELGAHYSASRESFVTLLMTTFAHALQLLNYPVCHVLLECGAVWRQDIVSHVIFHLRSRYARLGSDFLDFLSLLLSRGADPNLTISSQHGSFRMTNYTPLHFFISSIQLRLAKTAHNPDVSDIVVILRKLISHGANPLALASSRSILSSLLNICWPKHASSAVLMPVLRVLIEAGVSTYQPGLTSLGCVSQSSSKQDVPRPPCRTITWGQHAPCHHVNFFPLHTNTVSPLQMTFNLDVVEVLIRSGACSNHELFLWKQFLQTLPASHMSDDVLSLLPLLKSHTRCVPSLLSLSRQAVSHAIGCGRERERFLQRKDVPERMKKFVQFQDLFELESTHL